VGISGAFSDRGWRKTTMFMGEYHPSMDEKGRIALPARLRKHESGEISSLVLTHGFDKCIMALVPEEWNLFVENKLMILSQSEPENRKRVRFLLGGATECDLDKQGRILVPQYLKDYALVDGEITVLGLYNRIEIWSSKSYEGYKPHGEELDEIAGDLGF